MSDDDAPDRSTANLAANEQIKLAATYLNGIAIAIFAVGGLAPIVSIVSDTIRTDAMARLVVLSLVCALTSGALHVTAKHHLRRLRE